MWSATQTDISPNPEVRQTQDSSEKRPEVVIRIRKTESDDGGSYGQSGSTNIQLREALDSLEPYEEEDTGDPQVEEPGGRVFRTPVKSQDDIIVSENEGHGGTNHLSKTNTCEQESNIVEALTTWVNHVQEQHESEWSVWISSHLYADLNLAVDESVIDYDSVQVYFIGENLQTFMLTLCDLSKSRESTVSASGKTQPSETRSLGVNPDSGHCVTAEKEKSASSDLTCHTKEKSESIKPTRTIKGKTQSTASVGTLKRKAEPLESTMATETKVEPTQPTKSVKRKTRSPEPFGANKRKAEYPKATKTAEDKAETVTTDETEQFALQLATELTTELHKFCCVDFLLLPCVMTYKTFIDDLLHNEHGTTGSALQEQIKQEETQAEWYYSGPLKLCKEDYKAVKEASSLVADVSFVPCITAKRNKTKEEEQIWLLKLSPKCRRALSLLTEVLGSTEDATYTLTCSSDKYRTVEMIVLEAARRWAFSHDVVLRVPTHSVLDLDKTKTDLLHLTGKRKHTSYRMQIKMDGSALECRRYRGKRETEHLQKKAEVPTSQGGQHCCQCHEMGSECNRNDNCACRSTHTRCSANCLVEGCANNMVTATFPECCQCNEESECNSNNCACHSRHTRCSANCFAGGCTNKLTGECTECCRCNKESQCDSNNCECRSKGSRCSSRCFATGCGNHKIVMGQKVDRYLSNKQIQVLVQSQATPYAERKTTRPITQDTTQTSSIPASRKGSAPDNETEFLNAWFPCLDTKPYIIPSVHHHTVHVQKVNLAGGHSIKVLKTQEEREQGQDKSANKTVKIDRILKKIHYCLSHIKEAARQGELMVIMVQAQCSLYGANSRSIYTGAAVMNTDSKYTEAQYLREKFVDLLVIHRQYGVMMAATICTPEENHERLQEDIRKVVDYLEKAKKVVEDCVANNATPKPAIQRAVLLPNVTRDCLQGQLVKISDLKELEQRLGVEPGRSFSELCLCEDDMADQTRVERWWTTCLKRDGGADLPMMGQDVYRRLVTTFVTPLTTVQMYLSTEPRLQLWTLHDVVQAVGEEHGRDLSRIALFPRQLELVEDLPDQNKDDVIILYGPPGSSKTFLLLIKGSLWLKEGCKKVFVVQSRPEDGAASAFLVAHQLEKTAGQGPNSVQLVNTQDFWDNERKTWTPGGEVKYQAWVQQLCDHARNNPTGAVHILADEANCDHVSSIVKTLHHRGVRVNLWAAGVKLDIPADLQDNVRMLTEPLRSPPSVVREVEKARDMKDSSVPAYSVPPVAPPCDGPPLITIKHYKGRQGHEGGSFPWRCEECAKQVARVLLHVLDVGRFQGRNPQPLRYRDVFVLTWDSFFRDDEHDISGNVTNPASGFVRGLRDKGIPVTVLETGDALGVKDVATMAGPDHVIAAGCRFVQGLERKIVVYVQTSRPVYDDEDWGRLCAMSRCTSQLIWVKP